MKSLYRLFQCLALLLLSPWMPNISADILLPNVFSDHMTLQRNSTIPIAGTATPGGELLVSFRGETFPATADDQGKWMVQLTAGPAGGPFQIEIVATSEDAKVIISDVMVGDVWLCAGQSNMSRPVTMALNPEAEIADSKNYPGLRLFRVEPNVAAKPASDLSKVAPWQVCSPETVKEFSATGYFFGREIGRAVPDVPIGLISSAVAGTPCEAWISQEKIDSIDALKPLMDHWEQNTELNSTQRPANLFNAMIAPLANFPIRGVIWYQGESNVGRGAQYKTLFPALIEDWRRCFNQPELPFYFAQLAPFQYQTLSPESLPELWEAQLQTAKRVPQTGMAVLTDSGDASDIHPKNKQVVGQRLARLALGLVYATEDNDLGIGPDLTGPIFDSATNDDDRIRIYFSNCKSGLKVADGGQTVNGFTICGQDKQFVPATAVIVGDTVEVSATEVQRPQAVRFGWGDATELNLVNGNDLPASPFRTDEFPVTSASPDF